MLHTLKSITFAVTVVLKMVDEFLLPPSESRSLDQKRLGYTVESITLLGRTLKQSSSEKKERLKYALNKNISGLCDKVRLKRG